MNGHRRRFPHWFSCLFEALDETLQPIISPQTRLYLIYILHPLYSYIYVSLVTFQSRCKKVSQEMINTSSGNIPICFTLTSQILNEFFFSSRCFVTWRPAEEAGLCSSGDLMAAWTSRGAGGNTKWSV